MTENGYKYRSLSNCYKCFLNQQQFANSVTGKETWVDYFEPV